MILGHLGKIASGGITLTGGSTTVSLSESQAVYSGVSTALNKISNLTVFDVTSVHVGQIGTGR